MLTRVLRSKFRHDLGLEASDGGMLTCHMQTEAGTAGISGLKHRQWHQTALISPIPSYTYGLWLPWTLYTIHVVLLLLREVPYHIVKYCFFLLTVLLLSILLSSHVNIMLSQIEEQGWSYSMYFLLSTNPIIPYNMLSSLNTFWPPHHVCGTTSKITATFEDPKVLSSVLYNPNPNSKCSLHFLSVLNFHYFQAKKINKYIYW